ncbi:MAG TPA: hypothetical protein VHK00_02060 [Miltoncostaeaceae bacterium]|jgi:hypothetical protein|nr:hypothetical protein [Miltoncostaeaceae bacterium]
MPATLQTTTANGTRRPPPAGGRAAPFAAVASAELGRIDGLLGCRWPRGRRSAHQHGVVWSSDVRDPEFRKTLHNLSRLIVDAEGICRRVTLAPSEVAELTEAVSMPRRSPWTLEIVLARRFRLEALLIDLGDEKYLRERAAAFYTERHGQGVRWGTMYPRQVPPILAGSRSGRRPGPDDVDLTRRMLQQLVAAKQFDDVPVRNRNELTLRALRIIAPVVLLASVAFAIAIADVVPDDRVLQLAAAAGAIGAALGTLIRVRDDLVPGSQIRELVPFFISQVTVGATAGMLAFLVDRSGIVAVGGDASGLAAVAFALGFTEAAFLRLIARVATLAGGGAGAAPSVPTDPPRRGED